MSRKRYHQRKYHSVYSEAETDPKRIKYWQNFISGAPEDVLETTALYFLNQRNLWNNRALRLNQKEITELLAFQKALDNLGLSRYFNFLDR